MAAGRGPIGIEAFATNAALGVMLEAVERTSEMPPED
jgi:hypothetical protein